MGALDPIDENSVLVEDPNHFGHPDDEIQMIVVDKNSRDAQWFKKLQEARGEK